MNGARVARAKETGKWSGTLHMGLVHNFSDVKRTGSSLWSLLNFSVVKRIRADEDF